MNTRATVERGAKRRRARAESLMTGWRCGASLAVAMATLFAAPVDAQIRSCDATPQPPFCKAPPGDRAQGYARQTRSEVVSRYGIVTTSQALAAEAGMRICMQAAMPSTPGSRQQRSSD